MASTLPSQLPNPIRRSATLPTRLHNHTRTSALPSVEETQNTSEIFYNHENVVIKEFEPSASQRSVSISAGSTEYDYPVDTVETLPWRSSSEHTLSRGTFKLEQVPGSTAFFRTRNLNRPILRNSQCWCVDRESKFVLRVGRLKYWRIELPNETEDEKKKVQELKETLPNLLRYEKTPCPFKRGFTVELPEEAKTPKKKRPWRPKERPKIIQQDVPQMAEATITESLADREAASSGTSEVDTDGDSTDGSGITPCGTTAEENYTLEEDTSLERTPMPIPRSMTVPMHMMRGLSSEDPEPDSIPHEDAPETASLSSSVDSFHSLHSFHSPISPLPPSPPELDIGIPDYHRAHGHKRDISELTVTEATPITPIAPNQPMSSFSPSPRPTTPPNLDPSGDSNSEDDTFSEAITPGPDTHTAFRRRLRAKNSRRRALSPLPPPSTIFVPSSPKSPTNQLTHVLLQRTCSLVLGPPLQFLALLFHLATRLTSAEDTNSQSTSRSGSGNIWTEVAEAQQRSQAEDLTCDVRGSDVEGEEGWGEDDFGVPLGRPLQKTPSKSNAVIEGDQQYGGSWEID